MFTTSYKNTCIHRHTHERHNLLYSINSDYFNERNSEHHSVPYYSILSVVRYAIIA